MSQNQGSGPARSPLSPKALILEDLRQLEPGTELVRFNRRHHSLESLRFHSVYVDPQDPQPRFGFIAGHVTHPRLTGWHLADNYGQRDWYYAADCGLLPYPDGRWCSDVVMVLPGDIDTLPPKPNWPINYGE